MARIARVAVPNFPHLVTQRGNRSQKTFFCEDGYQYYVELASGDPLQQRSQFFCNQLGGV